MPEMIGFSILTPLPRFTASKISNCAFYLILRLAKISFSSPKEMNFSSIYVTKIMIFRLLLRFCNVKLTLQTSKIINSASDFLQIVLNFFKDFLKGLIIFLKGNQNYGSNPVVLKDICACVYFFCGRPRLWPESGRTSIFKPISEHRKLRIFFQSCFLQSIIFTLC